MSEREAGAEALLNLQPASSVSVKYAPNFSSRDDIKLLEVDQSLLSEILTNGVTIRGSHRDEDAVLCTSSKTFTIKFVSTSNSVFLFPPSPSQNAPNDDSVNEDGIRSAGAITLVPGHMELVQIAPKVEKLKSLLSQKPYKEESSMETEDRISLYTFEDLLENIQASEAELKEGLKSLAAVEIEGFWRIMDEKFLGSVLDILILSAVQHDWDLSKLRSSDVVSVLNRDGYPKRIAEHCLEVYGRRLETETETEFWCMDERLVCLRYAKQLLNCGKWKLNDFMEAWLQTLPAGLTAHQEMLRGEALFEQLGPDIWLRPFPASSLPVTPAERFRVLFKERRRWTWEDLEPYVRDLKVPGMSVEALLIKYTRRTQPTADSTPVFSAR